MKLTTEILWGFGPCYPPTRYFSEDWEGNLIEVLQDERIRYQDRIWVFSKAAPQNTCREFARWCALQVIDKWDAPDVVLKYLETGLPELRKDARAAASSAANALYAANATYACKLAAADAAYCAVNDADAANAAYAAANAAYVAAYSAASVAYASAAAAARDAVCTAQLQKAIELLNQ